MVDVAEGIPQGKALDQWESAPIEGFDTRVIGTNGYDETAGSDLVIVTAGIARKPGMSREDLLNTNAGIVRRSPSRSATRRPTRSSSSVSNPLDVWRYVCKKIDGLPARARDRHGRRARYRALPLLHRAGARRQRRGHPGAGARRPRRHDGAADLLHDRRAASRSPSSSTAETHRRARRAHAQRRRGDRQAISRRAARTTRPPPAAVQMAEAIVQDKKRDPAVLRRGSQGEYGMKGLFLGVPCKLGRSGLERIIEVELTEQGTGELESFRAGREGPWPCSNDHMQDREPCTGRGRPILEGLRYRGREGMSRGCCTAPRAWASCCSCAPHCRHLPHGLRTRASSTRSCSSTTRGGRASLTVFLLFGVLFHALNGFA